LLGAIFNSPAEAIYAGLIGQGFVYGSKSARATFSASMTARGSVTEVANNGRDGIPLENFADCSETAFTGDYLKVGAEGIILAVIAPFGEIWVYASTRGAFPDAPDSDWLG